MLDDDDIIAHPEPLPEDTPRFPPEPIRPFLAPGCLEIIALLLVTLALLAWGAWG